MLFHPRPHAASGDGLTRFLQVFLLKCDGGKGVYEVDLQSIDVGNYCETIVQIALNYNTELSKLPTHQI
jgi:hypothetical protein